MGRLSTPEVPSTYTLHNNLTVQGKPFKMASNGSNQIHFYCELYHF